jgi:hypothetical protein
MGFIVQERWWPNIVAPTYRVNGKLGRLGQVLEWEKEVDSSCPK